MTGKKPRKAPLREVVLDWEGYEGQTIKVRPDLPSGFLETAMGLFGVSGTFDLSALSPREARQLQGLLGDLRRDLAYAIVEWDLRDPYDDEPLPQPYKNPDAFTFLGFEALTDLTNLILSPPRETEKNSSGPSSPTSTGEE
ncbi:MAG: hypothetical protein FJ014_19825 [Chloroflexi bacterium]|nr:hypothetical protein [Chloroflexota bacterium]